MEDENDILMKFVVGGTAIDAEAQARFDTNDPLMPDFKLGKFCRVDDFRLGVGLQDTDDEGKDRIPKDRLGKVLKSALGGKGDEQEEKLSQLHALLAPRQRFGRWLDGMMKDGGYKAEFEPFSFSKRPDKTTPHLFELASHRKPLTSVALVQRKPVGGAGGMRNPNSYVRSRAFVRLDFTDVLIIGLDWDAEENFKETCKFIARSVSVQYLQQLETGTLDWLNHAEWHRQSAKKR